MAFAPNVMMTILQAKFSQLTILQVASRPAPPSPTNLVKYAKPGRQYRSNDASGPRAGRPVQPGDRSTIGRIVEAANEFLKMARSETLRCPSGRPVQVEEIYSQSSRKQPVTAREVTTENTAQAALASIVSKTRSIARRIGKPSRWNGECAAEILRND
jgi:hypothetical protein